MRDPSNKTVLALLSGSVFHGFGHTVRVRVDAESNLDNDKAGEFRSGPVRVTIKKHGLCLDARAVLLHELAHAGDYLSGHIEDGHAEWIASSIQVLLMSMLTDAATAHTLADLCAGHIGKGFVRVLGTPMRPFRREEEEAEYAFSESERWIGISPTLDAPAYLRTVLYAAFMSGLASMHCPEGAELEPRAASQATFWASTLREDSGLWRALFPHFAAH